ncbi:MAG: c(7)-type cytochrome triheme domain-containing protein [Desulfurivibrio sp.]|nr:c(7)-type cytochrome triheme domain-containing protein [Desulfurivibrio sp.]
MNKKTATILLLACLAALLLAVNSGANKGGNSETAAEPYDAAKYGPEAPIVWETPVQAKFSHQTHTKMGLSCDVCHGGLFEMRQGAATEAGDFTMEAFAEGKYCGMCHNGGMAFDTSTNCGGCHDAPDEPVLFTYPVKAVVFRHEVHVDEGGLDCEACHKEVFTMKKGSIEEAERQRSLGTDEESKRKYLEDLHNRYCGSCHDADQAFGYLTRCTVCHVGVKGYRELTGETETDQAH